jgi:hypothetical protein
VPTLVVHGTAERILPFAATAERLPGLIADLRLVRVEAGPHNICWTHPEEVNPALLEFLAEPVARRALRRRLSGRPPTRTILRWLPLSIARSPPRARAAGVDRRPDCGARAGVLDDVRQRLGDNEVSALASMSRAGRLGEASPLNGELQPRAGRIDCRN